MATAPMWRGSVNEERRAAWRAAITKQLGGEEVALDDHRTLLREGMFDVANIARAGEEAGLFLEYFFWGLNIDPLPWLGEIIAYHWFHLRDWDRRWQSNRAEEALRDYIDAKDIDHWTALDLIAARLHRAHEAFPEVLAVWAAEVHEGKREQSPRERGNKGAPPYAQEDRNNVYHMADDWLKHFGMKNPDHRVSVIARYIGDDESVVRKGLTRWRKNDWRRAPWPKG